MDCIDKNDTSIISKTWLDIIVNQRTALKFKVIRGRLNQKVSSLFNMINAAITPGTHPHRVKRNVITIDPQPRSSTAKGGKMMARITLNMLIGFSVYIINVLLCSKSFVPSTQPFRSSTEVRNFSTVYCFM